MHEQGFDSLVLNKTNTKYEGEPDMTLWNNFLNKLKNAEKSGCVVNVSMELPKSFVVCLDDKGEEKFYLSQLSCSTLLKRLETGGFTGA